MRRRGSTAKSFTFPICYFCLTRCVHRLDEAAAFASPNHDVQQWMKTHILPWILEPSLVTVPADEQECVGSKHSTFEPTAKSLPTKVHFTVGG